MEWDVVVVGAGAAGMLAAAQSAIRGRRTLLLEKNRKAGVKILMSGGTRCNITHDAERKDIVEAYGKQGRFLHSPLAALGPREVVQLFNDEGVATKIESTGKVFPVSDRALDVRDALVRRLTRAGATLALGEPVFDIRKSGERFEVVTSTNLHIAESVLITSGGRSYPGCGTTGDGYGWAQRFGHSVVPTRPALTPISLHDQRIKDLSGITLPDVRVRVVDPALPAKKAVLAERRNSFLFTHFGLSGPAVLDVSRAISGHEKPQSLRMELDFLPDMPQNTLDDLLREGSVAAGKRSLASLIDGVPNRVAETLLLLSGLDPGRKAAELAKGDRAKLVDSVKRLQTPVSGTLGFEKAEVTAGGVALSEVDSSTMRSKLVPNLFFAGEVLDLDGPIGGYNFQAAFSTGWLAGAHV